MSLVNALLALLLIVPVISWVTTVILGLIAIQRPYITALTERAVSALLKSIASTVVAVLVVNAYLHWFVLVRPWSVAVIAIALLLLEIPAVIWLALYLTDRFGDRSHD